MEETKRKNKRRSRKRNREIIYSLIIITILAGSGTYFYQIVHPKNTVGRKPFVPSIAPPKIQNNSQSPTQIFFAANGKDTIYKIQENNQWKVIWNGKESKGYDYVSNPVFSPDGTQFAFNAEIGNRAYVVVNNTQEINAYQKADNIVFSQNNQTIAFLAARNDNTYVVVTSSVASSGTTSTSQNVTESQPIAQPGTVTNAAGDTTSIIISPDGSHVAYIVQNGDQVSIVVNGHPSAGYDNVSNLTVNNDGTCSYQAQNGDQEVTVVNNKVTSTTSTTSDDSSGSSSTTTSSDTSTSGNNSTDSNNTSNQNSSSKKSSSKFYNYKYQYNSGQDVNIDPDQTDYSSCQSGNCN